MIAAAHVMAGLVAGVAALSARTTASRALVGFGLGVLTHVALDAIPHSDYGDLPSGALLTSVAIEIAATFLLAWYLFRSRPMPGLRFALPAGLAGAMMPDVKFLRYFLPQPAATWVFDVGDRFHASFHAEPPSTVAVGLAFEVVSTVLLFGVLLLLLRSRRSGDSKA